MKKKTFELRNYVIATGVFIMAVVVGILLFFRVRTALCSSKFPRDSDD